MLTLVVVLVVVAVIAAIVLAFGGFGPRVVRRTRVIDPPVSRPVRRRTVVEEESVDPL